MCVWIFQNPFLFLPACYTPMIQLPYNFSVVLVRVDIMCLVVESAWNALCYAKNVQDGILLLSVLSVGRLHLYQLMECVRFSESLIVIM